MEKFGIRSKKIRGGRAGVKIRERALIKIPVSTV
jgi:hypothetical protein